MYVMQHLPIKCEIKQSFTNDFLKYNNDTFMRYLFQQYKC